MVKNQLTIKGVLELNSRTPFLTLQNKTNSLLDTN
jgi:hypothetical protein